MTPDELVSRAAPLIGGLGSAWYFDGATLARGKELGLDGFRFYFLGRGGVLGDVEPKVVASAFGYFAPDLVDKMWRTAAERIAPREAGREYLECARAFGRRHFGEVSGLGEFCRSAEAVVAAAEPAALALFAGIAAEELPADLPARATQLTAVLREMRGSAHLVAVVASGLSPRVAHFLRRPDDYAMFGWAGDPPSVSDDDRAALARADELTDRLVRPAFAALDGAGADALMSGAEAMQAALAG